MNTRNTLFSLGLMSAIALAGCGAQPTTATSGPGFGSALVSVNTLGDRSVQYVAGDIKAVKVTVTTSVNGGSYGSPVSADFTGTSLASHLSNNVFTATVDNLKVSDTITTYSYQVTTTAYLESGETTNLGSSTSSGFGVTGSQTPATVSMPSLKLLATPVGSASAGVTIIDTPAPAVVIR